MSSCAQRCTHETPYYLASSIMVYISGLSWLIYSLYLDAPLVNAKDGVNQTWPYEYPKWECPFPLLIAITMSQIMVGGITCIFPIVKYHVWGVLFEYAWILLAILVTQAPPPIVVIHFTFYNTAILVGYIDYIKYTTKEAQTRDRHQSNPIMVRAASDKSEDHPVQDVPPGQAMV